MGTLPLFINVYGFLAYDSINQINYIMIAFTVYNCYKCFTFIQDMPINLSMGWMHFIIKTYITALATSAFMAIVYLNNDISLSCIFTGVVVRVGLLWTMLTLYSVGYVLLGYPITYIIDQTKKSVDAYRDIWLSQLIYTVVWYSVILYCFTNEIFLAQELGLWVSTILIVPIGGTIMFTYNTILDVVTGKSIGLSDLFYNNMVTYCQDEIPWSVTPSITKAQTVLTQMYNHVLTMDPDCVDFAKEYLTPLLSPLSGNTGLSKNIITSESIEKITYILKSDSQAYSLGREFYGNGIIYSFTGSNMSMNETYIGLTQSAHYRLTQHYYLGNRPNHVNARGLLYQFIDSQGGFSNIRFNVIHSFPTFETLWFIKHDFLSSELSVILRAFTEFKLGIYEQALFTHYAPGLNSQATGFHFIKWYPGYVQITAGDSFFADSATHELINTLNPTGFDFTLYRSLMMSRDKVAVDNNWLEWFVGFIEKRGHLHTQYHTNYLVLRSEYLSFLEHIKDQLGLTSQIIPSKNSYMIMINGINDLDTIVSICHNNIVTEEFLPDYLKVTAKVNSLANLEETPKGISAISLNNGWLSGLIDAGVTFMFTKASPMIRFSVVDNPFLVTVLNTIFAGGVITGTRLIFRGNNVIPILEYLDKYPLVLRGELHKWIKECMRMRSLGYHTNKENKHLFKQQLANKPTNINSSED